MASSTQGSAHFRLLELNNSAQKALFFFTYPALGFQLCPCESPKLRLVMLVMLSVMPRTSPWEPNSPLPRSGTSWTIKLPLRIWERSSGVAQKGEGITHHIPGTALGAGPGLWDSQTPHPALPLLPSLFLENRKKKAAVTGEIAPEKLRTTQAGGDVRDQQSTTAPL